MRAAGGYSRHRPWPIQPCRLDRRSYARAMTARRLKLPPAYGLARSDDGRRLACVGRNVVVLDMRERVRLSSSHPLSHPAYTSFSPNGEIIAVKSTGGRIVTVDPNTGTVVYDYANQKDGEGCGVYFSPDGSTLIDGSWAGVFMLRRATDGTIIFRDSYEGEMLPRISHDRERRSWLVQHSPIVREGENQSRPGYLTLHRWPIVGETARAFAFNMHIDAAQISPDGTRFCFFQKWADRRVHIARISDGQIVSSSPVIEPGGTGSELVWSDDGECIAALGKGKFVFLRATDLAVIGQVEMDYASSAIFMQDSDEVVLGSWKTSRVVRRDTVLRR